MNLRYLLSLGLFIILYTGLTAYIGWHLYYWLHVVFSINHPLIFTALLIGVAYAYIIGQLFSSPLFKKIGALWLAVFQFGLFVLPFANITCWLLGLFIEEVTRTHIVVIGGIVWILFAIYIGVGLYLAYSPVIRSHDISLAKTTSHKSSLKIVMASDMHFGGLSGKKHAERLVKEINKLNADIILLAGDIVDDDPAQFKEKKMDGLLANLHAVYGKYAVTGNHEYYGGKIEELAVMLDEAGIQLLQDDVVEPNEMITIVGRKDKTDKNRKSASALIDPLDKRKILIMMDHQPTDLHAIMEAQTDMVFSGHTHRGQIFPYHLITAKLFEVDWGYKQKGRLHVFVSSGFGFWGPPIRLGSRSEILSVQVHFNEC
ncbi:metallophosphoesterase [Salipaludibacillus agaradhaerens]|jgi:predicted MPP superfamily phosphohydrolase|uniref:metallophosphoesterase n=1 Tax=Salipaludibacillus agaradhaerens TaxID=76935 RepID=UPI000997F845|nr:metallophosphoesterase [Salipaludibacillus agaradhaerens]